MPPRPSAVSGVDPAFDAVLAEALAKDRTQRFGSATELAEALAAAYAERLDATIRERADVALRAHPWARGGR